MAARYWQTIIAEQSVYGIVSQYHVLSPTLSWKTTNTHIFNKTHVRLHPVLPCNIDKIAHYFMIEPWILLQTGTGYPLFSSVLRKDALSLSMAMFSDYGKEITRVSKQAQSSLELAKSLNYCPECVEGDEHKFGLGLWKTAHQLYGVSHCPWHKVPLVQVPCGEGGVNRKYSYPKQSKYSVVNKDSNQSLFLSIFIFKWFVLSQNYQSIELYSTLYKYWLDVKGYLTKCGNIRRSKLVHDLHEFWYEVFNVENPILPMELCNYRFVSRLVHSDIPMHYLKHALLMAFLTPEPKTFFDGGYRNEPNCQPKRNNKKKLNENLIVSHLKSGCSMRQVAKLTGYSVGAIKQVALRNGIEIGRRRQRITADMERDIWRKAFVGMHRQIIADFHRISVGAVEQIMQSHSGLSIWRKHLWFQDKLHFHRNMILAFINSNPDYSRNKIKHECGSYMWLYKHDNEWLYSHLPQAQSSKYHPSVDWSARDKVLAIKIEFMLTPCESISALDRQLGGHDWLTKYASKLPLSMAAAQSKLF